MPKNEKDTDKDKNKDKKPSNESTGISLSGGLKSAKISAFERSGDKIQTPIGIVIVSKANNLDPKGNHMGGKLQLGEMKVGKYTKLNGPSVEASSSIGVKGMDASVGVSVGSMSTEGSIKIPVGSGTLEIGGKAEAGIGIKYGLKGKYGPAGGSLEAKATIPVPIPATPIVVPVTVKVGASINYYPNTSTTDNKGPAQARTEQKEKALVGLTRDRMHDSSLNSFAPRNDFFFAYSHYNSPFSVRP